ncbi:MAG: hypothetical protein DMF59_15625 [Acidobacteria bacterium]|nr:MAG: hypothetical protein DMF59_15625 [Acidobacteriota bacterium]
MRSGTACATSSIASSVRSSGRCSVQGRRIGHVLDVALESISFEDRLRDITLRFAKSTHTAIVGPPASGASTLLQIIAGQLRPTKGHIHFGARDVTKLAASRSIARATAFAAAASSACSQPMRMANRKAGSSRSTSVPILSARSWRANCGLRSSAPSASFSVQRFSSPTGCWSV